MRRTINELTDAFASALTVVPHNGRVVCECCHGATTQPGSRCWSCIQTQEAVVHPIDLVAPISLCPSGRQLHHVLRNYKDSPRPQVRHVFTRLVGALFGRFLWDHGSCIAREAGGPWDYMTTVPSTRVRPGRRPLENALSMVRELAQGHRRVLEKGAVDVKRLRPHEKNFNVTADVRGDRILLLDDTFTTGTRIQAAASALSAQGASVAAAVVVGRFINPEYDVATQMLWNSVKDTSFDFDDCCLHYR